MGEGNYLEMVITPEIIKQHNLTEDEYRLIQETIGRDPNLVELGIFSVMWSEHCSYKSSRKFLKQFPTEGPSVVQGPGENAGIVDIGGGLCVAFKMESHNHPSFIEPYQGAATGVGGILRDVFTMGARPIANLNSLRFGSLSDSKTHFLVDGVVAGIAGYGNCMGIPTVGGEVFFDECYNGNNLVNAMTVGIVAKDKIFRGYASGPGNPVFYLGSKTGRDGIHGATMASDVFDETAEQKKPTVQVGDPFMEKKLLEACLELMSDDAIIGIQDMGAAGLTSSSTEMASRAGTGIDLCLDDVPLREEGMTPYEIMLSESQERMLFVCKKGKEERIKRIAEKWDLDVRIIGKVADHGRIRVRFKGEEVIDLPIEPLAHGAPLYDRPRSEPAYQKSKQKLDLKKIPLPGCYNETFRKMISHPDLASKKWVYRQYDHQVMTNTVVLPGSDASVLRVKGTKKGITVTTNGNGRYCFLDPYMGGIIAVAESGRNLVCSGAKPLAITDCLNFGNPERPEIMWQFERAVSGIAHACHQFKIPIVSGNVSFYNETNAVSVFPTPVIGMIGLLENIENRCDQFFKREGDVILLLGETLEELGGSEYLKIIHNLTQGLPPQLDCEKEKNLWSVIQEINENFLINSAHDISEGGFAIALAESCLGGNHLGASVTLKSKIRPDALLFGETQSCVIISAGEDNADKIRKISNKYGTPCEEIGKVTSDQFSVCGNEFGSLIDLDIGEVKKLWSEGFERGVFRGRV